MTTIITYGTFDLLHVGHLRLFERLKAMGDRLVVGISTDEFNAVKGKKSLITFENRVALVAALRCVDSVFPENSWEQKRGDIIRHDAQIFAIGDDWQGKFDELGDICKVVYVPRTEGVSSTEIRRGLSVLSSGRIAELKQAIDLLGSVAKELGT